MTELIMRIKKKKKENKMKLFELLMKTKSLLNILQCNSLVSSPRLRFRESS